MFKKTGGGGSKPKLLYSSTASIGATTFSFKPDTEKTLIVEMRFASTSTIYEKILLNPTTTVQKIGMSSYSSSGESAYRSFNLDANGYLVCGIGYVNGSAGANYAFPVNIWEAEIEL